MAEVSILLLAFHSYALFLGLISSYQACEGGQSLSLHMIRESVRLTSLPGELIHLMFPYNIHPLEDYPVPLCLLNLTSHVGSAVALLLE